MRKLLEKAEVVFEEQPNVLDLVSQDRDALDTDAECEAGIALRVVSHGLEDRRVDHAAPAKLNPACLLAHLTTPTVAPPAADIDLGARLGVGKKARPEAHARAL